MISRYEIDELKRVKMSKMKIDKRCREEGGCRRCRRINVVKRKADVVDADE